MLNHATFIWNAADILRGTYKQHQYGDVILPFTVLARLDAVLAPTKAAVLAATAGYGLDDEIPQAMLRAKAGHPYTFFNRSQHDLSTLQGDPDNLEKNLRDYVRAFSPNVRDIFERYKIEETILDLAAHDLLLQVLQHFAKVNLHPDAVSNEQMGHIFEELIRKFAEASNETAGEHFTPREVIELMVSLLVHGDESLATPGIVREVYDPTAGTGGMLSVAADRIHAFNPSAQVNLLGQEINPASYAICKADMVVKGQPIDNIVLGNTLTDPAFEGRTFHYGLSNPPFGVDWKQYRKRIETEHAVAGFAGRFGSGLPRVSDGSLLFLMHLVGALRELKPGDPNAVAGRGAIVLNGSPLFTGGAGSGESNIRKWILESDYLETIVGLPTDMFYNTGIATYVWVLNKDKPAKRRGLVQLIDATGMYDKMRKSIGSKRRMLSKDHIAEITRLFTAFEESKHSKIFRATDFFYRTITVERPLRLSYALSEPRVEKALASRALQKWDAALRDRLAAATARWSSSERSERIETTRATFTTALTGLLTEADITLTPAQLKTLVSELGEPDDEGELVTSAGKPVADASRRDTENVPWDEDIRDYLEREVKPFVPDAWIDESKTKEGAEIPFTRHFYEYVPPRPLAEIDRDLDEVLGRIRARLEQGEGVSFRTVPVKAVATLNPETLSEDTDSDRIFSYAEISDVSVGQPVRWQEPSPFGSLPSRARRVVRDGDVIISTVRTYLRAVAHVVDAPATAVVSTGFAVFRPARIDARFLGYALEETHFVDRVVAASVGVSYPAVNASDIARLPISAPSPDIQRQIADYLDHETAEIDAFIADLGIARAFSQEGLVVQRDRIFGDYAAAASVAELRGKISESDERASATASSADLLTVSIASGVTPRGEWTADQHRADDLTKYKVVRVGDIVLNRMRAFQGAVGVSRNNGITSPDYAVLRCDRRTLLPEFAANLLKSPRFVYEITRRLRGIGNEESGQVRTPRVAVADLIRIPTKVPELEVQQRAVDQWAAEQRLASEVSRDFDAAITLAKERRAALITAAVTGQIDVTTTQTPAVDDIQTAIEESR